ncbi:hypothetical protein C1H46_024622 [Malus baccata]|uniref:Uncharacterized protein n=1 Tax=Malus baccata TaxID=106549 RepID=A0A540LTS1_MALBA|nr:hypothetical protein C1H46_024622 [Malus baccata]
MAKAAIFMIFVKWTVASSYTFSLARVGHQVLKSASIELAASSPYVNHLRVPH